MVFRLDRATWEVRDEGCEVFFSQERKHEVIKIQFGNGVGKIFKKWMRNTITYAVKFRKMHWYPWWNKLYHGQKFIFIFDSDPVKHTHTTQTSPRQCLKNTHLNKLFVESLLNSPQTHHLVVNRYYNYKFGLWFLFFLLGIFY